MLVRDGRVHAREAHLRRLANSVGDLYGLGLPADLPVSLAQHASALVGAHRLRVDASPDRGALRIELQTTPLAAGRPEPRGPARRSRCSGGVGSHKWCDRRLLESLAGPGRVPLLVDRDGDVLEAAWANVWLIEGRMLVTPPADGRLLPGVTRGLLIELAPRAGYDVTVEPISMERVQSAPAIFLTSALRLAVSATLQTGDVALASAAEPPAVAAIRALLSRSCWA